MTKKDEINNRDLLTLLSFADSQTHILQKFGVDTKIISDLNVDLLRQYMSVTAKLMKTWIGRIHEADIKGDSEVPVIHLLFGFYNSLHFTFNLLLYVAMVKTILLIYY
jgi:hypothetical protein